MSILKKNAWTWLLIVLAAPFAAAQEEVPTWAYYFPDEVQPQISRDRDAPRTLEGSDRTYTQNQIDDMRNSPNWFPDMYPPIPDVVLHGESGNAFACATCHLTSGMGHPESSSLAGLTVPYMIRQVQEFRDGNRTNPVIVDGEPQNNATQWMIALAHDLSEEGSRAAAEYFTSLEPIPGWVEVKETDTVPKTFISPGYARHIWPDGGEEPIGNRVIEVPKDAERDLLRDPRSGTIAYVPVGSIERGRILATTGGEGRTLQCFICHGPDLTGIGDVPGIAGRSPTYTFRQMFAIKNGNRIGPTSALMQATVVNLTQEDMIALAAYTGTLSP